MISRRSFVATLASLTAGAGALAATAAPTPGWRDMLRPPRLSPQAMSTATFAGLTGTHVTLRKTDGPSIRARLVDVTDLNGYQERSARPVRQMSLLFELPRHAKAEAGQYVVTHPLAGTCTLDLNPVGPAEHRTLEAVIATLA